MAGGRRAPASRFHGPMPRMAFSDGRFRPKGASAFPNPKSAEPKNDFFKFWLSIVPVTRRRPARNFAEASICLQHHDSVAELNTFDLTSDFVFRGFPAADTAGLQFGLRAIG